ncbi:hypothetical protein KHA94_18220 [Bacillus sp. FJAT-49705]|uniref:Uncharacterized protein n=1 Tax=Cytobacillus citreus TaxID=2833586 RepID=A0ABS5NXH5_9BACI|nr:hypothetical protein [Cytobacillus citreus]MBS4192104.1 hypothetical protein [Cytobacillus citreus]
MEKGVIMGCCSPNYRKIVNEDEDKVNEKGKESIPLFVKIISAVIIIGGLMIAFLI